MASCELTDGTVIEFESLEEEIARLLKVANSLYSVCKKQGLTIKEVETVTQYLLDKVKNTHL